MTSMTLFGIATATELTKFRRALLPRIATVMLVGGITAIASSFMWASLQPGSAMAIKLAALVTEDGWAGYLGLTSQIAATAGGIGPGVVLAWLFGREFADGTITGLFALPVDRATIARAKLLVFAGWSLAFCLALVALLIVVGMVLGLGLPGETAMARAGKLLVVLLLSSTLSLPAGLAASLTKGYLGGIGAVIAIVIVSQIAVATGAGGWFTFAAPGLWAATPGASVDATTLVQLLLVLPLSALFAVWIVHVWRRLQLT